MLFYLSNQASENKFTEKAETLPLQLISRRFRNEEAPIIKPSSLQNNIAVRLIQYHPQNKAIFLTQSLVHHLASALARKKESSDSISGYQATIASFGSDFQVDTKAHKKTQRIERATIDWLGSIMHSQNLQEDYPQSVTPYHFEDILKNPVAQLQKICDHLALETSTTLIEKTLASPSWQRYAKQEDVKFSSQDYFARGNMFRENNAEAIKIANQCIQRIVKKNAKVAQAVEQESRS